MKPDFQIGDWVEWIMPLDGYRIQLGMKGIVTTDPRRSMGSEEVEIEMWEFNVRMVGYTAKDHFGLKLNNGDLIVDDTLVKKIDSGPEKVTCCPSCYHMWEET